MQSCQVRKVPSVSARNDQCFYLINYKAKAAIMNQAIAYTDICEQAGLLRVAEQYEQADHHHGIEQLQELIQAPIKCLRRAVHPFCLTMAPTLWSSNSGIVTAMMLMRIGQKNAGYLYAVAHGRHRPAPVQQ